MEDFTNYYIVSEILEGGELMERLINMKQFSEKKGAYVIKQVLLAINYMHK
jgi:serine/threonine protein kinase